MKKAELLFRNMLEGMDEDFADFMLEQDYQLLDLDGLTRINPFDFRKNYWSKPTEEVTINPNANLGNTGYKKNFCNLISEMASPINKLSALKLIRKYGNRENSNGDMLVNSILNGELYHHNLTLYDIPSCIGLSVYPITVDGLTFGGLLSNPPHRPTSFVNVVIRYIQIASNHFAGATALTDFFPNYSFYTSRQENYSAKDRENDLQNLIHGITDEVRLSGQSPFSNMSIMGPESLRIIYQNYKWNNIIGIEDLLDEIMMNQRIFTEFIAKGQLGPDRKPNGLPYRFPITTIIADPSFEQEYPVLWKDILESNANLCHLNFMSNMTTDLKSLAMCCRLTQNIEDILSINVSNTFGSFLQVGSHAVVSINLPRIAYESKGNTDEFLRILEERCSKARELLKIHRIEILQKRRLKYHYFFKQKYLNLKRNFFSTIGFIGLANAIEVMGENVLEVKGIHLAKKILEKMKELSIAYSQEDGWMYNIEEVPAESASGTLAKKDKQMVNGTYDYYDSQFVPLSYDCDVFKRIEVEGELQEYCTGGSISHINLDGRPNPESLYKLTDRVLKRSKLRQFAFNAGFTVCQTGHVSTGIFAQCPNCNSNDVDWVTRIVGYFTPVSAWNRAKQLEFKTRKWSKF